MLEFTVTGYIIHTDRTPMRWNKMQLFALNNRPARCHSFDGLRHEFINAWRDQKGGASKGLPWLIANITLPPMAYSTHPESKCVYSPIDDEDVYKVAVRDLLDGIYEGRPSRSRVSHQRRTGRQNISDVRLDDNDSPVFNATPINLLQEGEPACRVCVRVG
jgi:hypothetical protein